MSIETSPGAYIDRMIREGKSFAAFRLPGQPHIRLVCAQPDGISVYRDIRSLNGKAGFVIAPFRIAPQHPVVLIEGREQTMEADTDACPIPAPASQRDCTEMPPAYAGKYRIFMEPLRSGALQKVILSRSVVYPRAEGSSPASIFLKACRRYIYSYVYLCYTPLSGMWLGSTPELLLSDEGGSGHTVALAGTKRLQNGRLPTEWDAKNTEEQRIVARYIHSRLAGRGITAGEDGPYAVRAGELAHLRSDFRFVLPDSGSLGDLLHLLHPTPAVCGMPGEEAYRFIRENEGYDREYYSGFIGMLNPGNISNIYVNLRCMKVGEAHYTLYTGGGLLPSSTPEEEWTESEDKLLTMKAII